jgi:hypothetical protein
MLRELDFVESDWGALFWALGSATALFKHLEPPMSNPSDIFSRTQVLMKEIRRRTIIGFAACFIVIVAFGSFIFIFPNTLQRVGSGLTVAAALYMAYQLYVGRNGKLPSESRSSARTDFYRAELERQRNFHRGFWLWSRLIIMVPGYLLFLIGFVIAHPDAARFMAAPGGVFIVLCIIGVPANLKLSRKYQRRIDEVHALPKTAAR